MDGNVTMQMTTEHTGIKQGLTVGERGSLTRAQFTLPGPVLLGAPAASQKAAPSPAGAGAGLGQGTFQKS